MIVQKFGGTSVASREGRSALGTRVSTALADGSAVVVVVSAMGRSGDPYATDSLLALLDGFTPEVRERDLLMSCGETLSAVVTAHELRSKGIDAIALTGAQAGIVTDDLYGSATIIGVDPARLRAELDAGRVPVVTGFQGMTVNGETTTLGRGGSDTTACALGAALSAEAVEIYTDVEGVMSADPRACDGARVLDALQYEELFQMALSGAKVIHAPAAETAMEAGVPVRVRGTFSHAVGTLVSRALAGAAAPKRVATAVTHVDGIVRFVVTLPVGAGRSAALTAVFRSMADAGVSLDMFTPFEDDLALSVGEPDALSAGAVLDALGLEFRQRTGLAKVTLVGAGMHGVPGVMARIADALDDCGADIVQIADSHYTISVLVDADHARSAIESLHAAFELGVE